MNDVEYFLNDDIVNIIKEQTIIIDPEIHNRLWKLKDVEYENLKQSLIKEGCRDALILYEDILIDGHNRGVHDGSGGEDDDGVEYVEYTSYEIEDFETAIKKWEEFFKQKGKLIKGYNEIKKFKDF